MEGKDIFKNIITIGAHNRIQNEIKEYELIYNRLISINELMEKRKAYVNNQLLVIVEIKKSALRSLNKIKNLKRHLRGKEREFIVNQISSENVNWNFEIIENTLNVANTLLAAGKGAGAGFATGTAAYYLVGQFAAASTGTAISSLSGVAATNATLAWLGGGSLATGGGGMAAGSLVLGGIIAIPALAVYGLMQHFSASKQIENIKEQKLNALTMINDIRKNILALDLISKRSTEISDSIIKSQSVFVHELKKVKKLIYPIPVISRLSKYIRKLLGHDYFSKSDLLHMSYILKNATEFAKLIDTKVVDNS